jgi:transcriptional regulator with XRE-family HTH domain
MIISAQIRAARSLLRWTTNDLAQASGVSVATIKRFEAQDGIPAGQPRTLQDLMRALEVAGIEFIGTPENGPGVRLRALKS